jgi:uncharacterized protein (DUF2147 family)
MKKKLSTFILLMGVSLACSAFQPVGEWKTIDDKTKKPRAIISIREVDGALKGTIVKVFKEPGDKGLCVHCHGADKNKPIVGLTILKEMKAKTDNVYEGGSILDPKSGKEYRCVMKQLSDKKIEVRGFIGMPLLGRTQVWQRQPSGKAV